MKKIFQEYELNQQGQKSLLEEMQRIQKSINKIQQIWKIEDKFHDDCLDKFSLNETLDNDFVNYSTQINIIGETLTNLQDAVDRFNRDFNNPAKAHQEAGQMARSLHRLWLGYRALS